MVQYTIDGGGKGKDGEIFRRDEEVSNRVGMLNNSKVFLHG
jgi:hypothetical protein